METGLSITKCAKYKYKLNVTITVLTTYFVFINLLA